MQNHKRFNTTGVCIPKLHYMVDISAAVEQIVNEYISNGEYFTINRARQFGKTTLLEQLHTSLKQNYIIIYISFEAADDCFVSLYTFAQGFVNKVARALEISRISKKASDIWSEPISRELPIDSLNQKITNFCRACDQEVILIFLMYLKPIINGTGNFYVEDQSRTKLRSDIVVDYRGKQYVIECKIWHGDAYNQRREEQLGDYLDAYRSKRGYLLSFNFNKNKRPGIKEIVCWEKRILEVMV